MLILYISLIFEQLMVLSLEPLYLILGCRHLPLMLPRFHLLISFVLLKSAQLNIKPFNIVFVGGDPILKLRYLLFFHLELKAQIFHFLGLEVNFLIIPLLRLRVERHIISFLK
jgi:hypothetical protein